MLEETVATHPAANEKEKKSSIDIQLIFLSDFLNLSILHLL
jgi:hypothetical protein